ncbi:MAG: hypothetical protein HOE11_05270 [Candidatus Diapherotrites archaeon]|nr:hypothetical protein [Candidatus Diapherotrites archaeon]
MTTKHMLRRNNNQNVPPKVKKTSNQVIQGKTKIVLMVLFFSIVVLHNLSSLLQSIVPFGNYLWIIAVVLFLFCVIKISQKINLSLGTQDTNIAKEYNTYGDKQLFNQATKTGTLKDAHGKVFTIIMLPICFLFLTFGILALHLALIEGLSQFLFMGTFAVLLSLGVPYGFFYSNKRILNEARRQNKFLERAEQKWSKTKKIYLATVTLTLIFSLILIGTGNNFVRNGDLYSGNKLVYSGQANNKAIADCFELAYSTNRGQFCDIHISGQVDKYKLFIQIDKQIRERALQDNNIVLGEHDIQYCLLNKNSRVFEHPNYIEAKNLTTIITIDCQIGNFYFSNDDLPLVEESCPNYKNCRGYKNTCCLGIIN